MGSDFFGKWILSDYFRMEWLVDPKITLGWETVSIIVQQDPILSYEDSDL